MPRPVASGTGVKRLNALSELKDIQLLSEVVRKISGADGIGGVGGPPGVGGNGNKSAVNDPAFLGTGSGAGIGEGATPEMSAGSSSSLEGGAGVDGGSFLGKAVGAG